jgi:hypothetical protein
MQNFHRLVTDIQNNCDITDARHARNMTMCIYLLEMRQYYRWEHDIPYSQSPPKSDLGSWLVKREQHWDAVEDSPYAALHIGDEEKDPFAIDDINDALIPQGYVYSAGYGRFHKPHFFLGQLLKKEQRDGYTILVSGCEYARDMIAPPAALQKRTIYLRREAVKRMIWEKYEEWRWSRRDKLPSNAFSSYDFEHSPDAALEIMTDRESEAMILHELGEGLAGELLGDAWERMLSENTSRRVDIMARAVRDHLADCLSTLPKLIDNQAISSLHFYFINLDGMRRVLFPLILSAQRDWLDTGRLDPLKRAAQQGKTHWLKMAQAMLAVYRQEGVAALEKQLTEEGLAL